MFSKKLQDPYYDDGYPVLFIRLIKNVESTISSSSRP